MKRRDQGESSESESINRCNSKSAEFSRKRRCTVVSRPSSKTVDPDFELSDEEDVMKEKLPEPPCDIISRSLLQRNKNYNQQPCVPVHDDEEAMTDGNVFH